MTTFIPHEVTKISTPPIRILVIEDSKSDLLLVNKMLHTIMQHQPIELADASRMADALALLDELAFDIVLLDLNLPDIDGVASVTALHTTHPNLPIVVYSGDYDPQLRQEAILCGATYYLVKGSKENSPSLRFMIQQACACEAA